jgi:hypothetical protein
MMKITRKGKVVMGLIILTIAYLIATQIWWVGNGWCIGSVDKCLLNR